MRPILLWFCALALLLAACGPEAPPVAEAPPGDDVPPPTTRVAPTTIRATPASDRPRPSGITPLPTVAVAPELAPEAAIAVDPRSEGDPAAPITVVEFSDFQ